MRGKGAAREGGQSAGQGDIKSMEQRWCPETWQWYTWQQLCNKYSTRWGEDSVLDYWDWKMQRNGAESEDSLVPVEGRALRLPHGVVKISDTTGRYLVFKPPGFGICEIRWPVLVFLHGHHEINKPQVVAGFFQGRAREFDEFALCNFYIIAPLAEWDSALLHPDRHQFDIDKLIEVLAIAIRREAERLDLQRICVTGYSMGADAAASLVLKAGDKFAAAALFAGSYPGTDAGHSLPVGTDLEHAKNVQLRCFHNEADSYIGVERTHCFLESLKHNLEYNAPTVRKISIPYPTDALTIFQYLRASAELTAHLNIRITELDGGSKASWIFKDAVHLADGHVCWPIVYGSESTFGLFHWMLSCNRSVPRLWPRLEVRTMLGFETALNLLADLAHVYESNSLQEVFGLLATSVGRNRFTFLLYAQQLANEIHKPVLEKWKFRKTEAGVHMLAAGVHMLAALSDQLMETEIPISELRRDRFQKEWDAVRKALYGTMYHDCWSPSQERGDASSCVLPHAAVDRARGIGHPFTPEQGKELVARLSQSLKSQRAKVRVERRNAEIKHSIPRLTMDEHFSIAEELRDAFAQPEFQVELEMLRGRYGHEKEKYQLWVYDAALKAQVSMLKKYGFPCNRLGAEAVTSVLTQYITTKIPPFDKVLEEQLVLLGWEDKLLLAKTPEEMRAIRERAEVRKVWLRDGVGSPDEH